MTENEASLIYVRDEFLNVICGLDHSMTELARTIFQNPRDTKIAIDRTGTITCPLRTKNIFPIPTFDINFNKNIKDICDDAARDILSEGKPVDIFWSGGIDSTLAVVSFLNVCKDLSQINIMFEERSIDEYPLFYNKYVKNMNHTLLKTYISKNLHLEGHSVVTGECGGLLTGFWSTLRLLLERLESVEVNPNIPWQDPFKAAVPVFKTRKQDDFFTNNIADQIKKAPFKIESIGDLHWWLGFSTKWSGEMFLRLGWQTTITQAKLDNFKPFFATEEFQKWGMWNYYTNIRNKSWPSFKPDYKKIIYDFTKDEEYFLNKGKVSSGLKALSEGGRVGQPYIDAIDDQYNVYTASNINSNHLRVKIAEQFKIKDCPRY